MADESWRECVKWLERCEAIGPENKLVRGEGRLKDLINYLANGVAVCYLLNRLLPNAVDLKSFSQRPQNSQYLRKKNIHVFLDACKNVFGLSDSDLFTTQDLFETEEFEEVIYTLSKLSQTDIAKKSVPDPFFLSNRRCPKENGMQTLTDELDFDDDMPIYGSSHYEDEEIYDVLVQGEPEPSSHPEKTVPVSKKSMCVAELMSTEKKYLDVLCMIKQHFMEPLFHVLDQADFAKIFLKIEDFIQIHQGFYSDLLQANDSSSDNIFQKTTSDCFIMWKEKFLIYGEFCSNMISAQELIETLCSRSAQIRTAIEICQLAANGGKFRLHDLLPVPMQRILKYALLLQEMIKNSEPDDPERRMLKKALDEMKDLSLYVNEVKRDNEMLQLINDIERNITGLKMPRDMHLQDYGRLQLDGLLKVKSGNDTYSRNVFLFDKLMLLCKSKNDANSYKEFLIMSHYVLDEALPVKETKDKGFVYGFVLRKKGDPGSCYVFGAKSEDLRSKWIEVINLTSDNRSPQNGTTDHHRFVMASYSQPTICDVCRKLLRGVFFQGYKCSKTHMSVHKECIKDALSMAGPPTVVLPVRRPSVPSIHSKGHNKNQEGLHQNNVLLEEGACKTVIPRVEVRFPPTARMVRRNTEPELPPAFTHGVPGSPTGYNRIQSLDSLTSYPWFVSSLGRDEAAKRMQHLPNGTFLVRPSEKGGYALTVKYDYAKHIRIVKRSGRVTLDEGKYFISIPELISHHQQVSLEESFSDLPTVLSIPFKEAEGKEAEKDGDLKYCQASYNYSATESDQLSLNVGDLITIISKTTEPSGWWKGWLNGKIGYFPYTYVTEL